ncbi:prolipoprotein diacylglyceryl transferase [Bacillus sp. J33]|uniref:prolipoprotein diacylglyceryl transferase n=1 Tax=Bacillus sp. J33 TaxID=935836 RepID=UPI00047D3DB9|nr:prolipoprotein diacylglyceryl transferase [Bacillus sp. J33]
MDTIQPIDRIAFEVGPITVYWYGIIIAFGIFIGLYLAAKEAKRSGFNKDIIIDLMMWAIPIAIISARLYYVIFKWEYYSNHLGEIIAIWEGGIAIHGALIGAALTAIVFAKKRGVSFWKLADILAPSIILGQAIGRWGNFMNQEAHGGPVTREFLENLQLPDLIINQMFINGQYYHPAFLYESIWNIAGFIVLLLLRRISLRQGELFLSYIIWYSIGRFIIEGMRTDSLMLTETLRMAQFISIMLILSSVMIIFYRRNQLLPK